MSTTAYTHVQNTPSLTWVINHNLNCYPVMDVVKNVSGTYVKAMPASIVYNDVNQVTLTFSSSSIGVVRAIGLYQFALLDGAGSVDPGANISAPVLDTLWFLDTFSDPDTPLSFHFANSGEVWVVDGLNGYNAERFNMNGGGVTMSTAVTQFNGDQTYLSVPVQTTDFSFETRMKFLKLTGGGNDNTARLIVGDITGAAFNFFQVQLNTSGDGLGTGRLVFEGSNGDFSVSFGPINADDLPVDEYFTARVEVSNSSQNYALYIDGILVDTGALAGGSGGVFNYVGLDGYNGEGNPQLITVDYASGWSDLTTTGKSAGLGFTIFRDEFSGAAGLITAHTPTFAPAGSTYVGNGVDFPHTIQPGFLVLDTESTYSESILNFTSTEAHAPYASQRMSMRGHPGSGDVGIPAEISYSAQNASGAYYLTLSMKSDPGVDDSVKVEISTQSTSTSQTYSLGAGALSGTEYKMWIDADTTGVDVHLRNNDNFLGVTGGSTFLGRITAGSCTAIEFGKIVFKSWNASTAADGFINAAYLAAGGTETASTPYLALGLRGANLQYSYGVTAVDGLVATPINIASTYGVNVTVHNQKYITFTGTGSCKSDSLYATYGTFACEYVIGGGVDAVGVYSCDEGSNPFDPDVFMGSAGAQETSAFYHKSGYISFGLGVGNGTSIVNVAAAVDGDVIGIKMESGWVTPSFYKNGVLLASGSFNTISGTETLIAAKA